ncbi:TetR/AcrR family transcriptional regulator [Flindersiella endophytica]
MTIQARRERERAEREQLIIESARELAEAEGWDAVTTRRLAERVGYSQPVLYSHFAGGKSAIMAAVALEGFASLADELRAARSKAGGPREEVAAIGTAYTAFAGRHPALYDVMFGQAVDLPFATAEAPPALQAGFNEIAEAIRPFAAADDLVLLTETYWAALHGLITLARGGRLPKQAQARRLELLLDRFTV